MSRRNCVAGADMWFKVDDKLHDHRKARAAGATAMGVWVLAGSWAADNLTDGFIPATILSRWGRPRDAERLVDVGLWRADEQDGELGWRFHQWGERQPLRAQKLAERAARAEAGKVGGLASGRSRRQAKQEQFASPVVEPPSRPVPTQPDPTEALPPARGHQLPHTWQPNEAHRSFAAEKGINLGREVDRFRDHHLAKGSVMKDWDPAFRNWLRKAEEWAPAGSQQSPRVLPMAHELEQPPDNLSAGEYAAWHARQREKRRA